MAKIFKERALLEQPFIKDTGKTVAEHIKAQVAAIGENIQVSDRRGCLDDVNTRVFNICLAKPRALSNTESLILQRPAAALL